MDKAKHRDRNAERQARWRERREKEFKQISDLARSVPMKDGGDVRLHLEIKHLKQELKKAKDRVEGAEQGRRWFDSQNENLQWMLRTLKSEVEKKDSTVDRDWVLQEIAKVKGMARVDQTDEGEEEDDTPVVT